MTSGTWGSGEPAGDTGTSERRTTGDVAPLRTGNFRRHIQVGSLTFTLLCVGVAVVTTTANAVLILASIGLVIFTWSVDGFKRSTWVSDDPMYGAIDEAIDRDEGHRE